MRFRPIRDLRELNRTLDELRCAHEAAEESARFELARSATRFSRRSREVVDSTMNLSAVLMRAGEVAEANRLLAEAHREVATEEAALLETVHYVEAEGAVRREKMTRLRLAKLLATALLGASVFVTSAFGIALASWVTEEPENVELNGASPGLDGTHQAASARATGAFKTLKVAGVKLRLTPAQMDEYRRLTAAGDVPPELESFLAGVIGPDLARQVHAALAGVASTADATVADVAPGVLTEAGQIRKPSKENKTTKASAETGDAPDEPQAPADDGSNDEPEGDDDGRKGGSDSNNNAALPDELPVVTGDEDDHG